tara:strand:- start:598 stop:1362 length:765 start_codon:yes stop_codon:yes gene_type:complete
MGAVLVIKSILQKELSEEDMRGAAFGEIPADLGGGRMGSRNVPRGRDTVEGRPRVQWTPPSDEYRERMRGGGDVRHWKQGEGGAMSGQRPIPHMMSDPDVSPERKDAWTRRMQRMGPGISPTRQQAKEGTGGQVPSSFSRLMSAARRQGEDLGQQWTDEPNPRRMWGGFSDGAGGVETDPHERRNTELGGTLNRPGTGIVPGEAPDDTPGRVGVRRPSTTQGRQPLGSGAREHGRDPFTEADEPEGSGNRRTEE